MQQDGGREKRKPFAALADRRPDDDGGLDEPQRRHVKALLDRFCGAPGKTLLMVTHYPEEYPACIDHSLTL